MNKWKNKVCVITGANSGCGLKFLKELAKYNLKIIGLDLKDDELKKLKSDKLNCLTCDVTSDVSVESTFLWIEVHFGGVDILINCAGISNNFGILDYNSPMEQLEKCMNVNCVGAIRCARLAFKSMDKRGGFGSIININ